MSQKKVQIGRLFDPSFSQMDPKEVFDNLQGISYHYEDTVYNRKLTEEELTVKRFDLAETSIEISKIEQKKKDAMDAFKAQLKEPNIEKNQLLKDINMKSVEEEGTLFYCDDQEEGVMYIIDQQGVCIDSRPLRAKERQTKMRTINEKVG